MIHEFADVQSIHIGENTRVWQFTVILPDAVIGADCNINAQCFIENDVVVGDRVTVKPGVQLWDGLRVEDDVFIGSNATFTNDMTPRSKRYPEKFLSTTLRKGCSIGANATLLCGIEIGEYALVGAGAVVTRSIPPYTTWVGTPARLKGYICQCGKRLNNDNPTCTDCGISLKQARLFSE